MNAVFSYRAPLNQEPSEYRIEFPDLNVLHFNFRVVQLNRLRWRDFLDRTNPIAAALMANMAMEPGEPPHVKLACLRMLARLQLDPARERLISCFTDEYLRLTIEQKQLLEAEMKQLAPEEKEDVMELVNSWMEEGIEQGERRLLLRQLRKQLGAIDDAAVAQIGMLATESLEKLGEALLGFTNHGDLNGWLESHPD